MRKLLLLLLSAGWASTANAKVLELYGQAQLGGQFGHGLSGAHADDDFFQKSGNVGYGALIGVELFWVDFWVEHVQTAGSDSFSNDAARVPDGTWTQFM